MTLSTENVETKIITDRYAGATKEIVIASFLLFKFFLVYMCDLSGQCYMDPVSGICYSVLYIVRKSLMRCTVSSVHSGCLDFVACLSHRRSLLGVHQGC